MSRAHDPEVARMPEGLFSPMHILIILVIVAIFFGAKRLPELGKGLGSGIREFKSGLSELHSDVTDEPAPAPEQPRLAAAPAVVVDAAAVATPAEAAPAPEAAPAEAASATATASAQESV
jgi:sec-independent protein translocase protein TatA